MTRSSWDSTSPRSMPTVAVLNPSRRGSSSPGNWAAMHVEFTVPLRSLAVAYWVSDPSGKKSLVLSSCPQVRMTRAMAVAPIRHPTESPDSGLTRVGAFCRSGAEAGGAEAGSCRARSRRFWSSIRSRGHSLEGSAVRRPSQRPTAALVSDSPSAIRTPGNARAGIVRQRGSGTAGVEVELFPAGGVLLEGRAGGFGVVVAQRGDPGVDEFGSLGRPQHIGHPAEVEFEDRVHVEAVDPLDQVRGLLDHVDDLRGVRDRLRGPFHARRGGQDVRAD